MSDSINLIRIKAVADCLKEINEDIVFVGGATVSLYADENSAEARPTDDVDIVIEIASYASYANLDRRLRSIGFLNDTTSGVICRYIIQGIIVDIMPTDPQVIGFSNKWYQRGFENAIPKDIDKQIIKIFSLPFFIASKLEAFKSRGSNDYRFSSDFEDIVYVLENNSNAQRLLSDCPNDVKEYLKTEFQMLLIDSEFEEGLYAHLEVKTALQQIKRIKQILYNLIKS